MVQLGDLHNHFYPGELVTQINIDEAALTAARTAAEAASPHLPRAQRRALARAAGIPWRNVAQLAQRHPDGARAKRRWAASKAFRAEARKQAAADQLLANQARIADLKARGQKLPGQR